MFRVLIVDDEAMIVSLIEKLVPWDHFQMEVVGRAYNGIEAMEQAIALQPDIIIVDVRMPGCDGLTFMKNVRELNERVRFIVISGHKRFEYAKSAMQYNVEDYLIKPIDGAELERILGKLQKSLTAEQEQEQRQIALSTELSEKNLKIQHYFAEQYFAEPSDEQWSQPEKTINLQYMTNLQPGAYQAVVLKLDTQQDTLDEIFTKKLLSRIWDTFHTQVRPICWERIGRIRADRIEAIINYPADQADALYTQLELHLQAVRKLLSKFEALRYTICLGDSVPQLSQGHVSLQQANRNVWARLVLGTDRMILPEDIRTDSGALSAVLGGSTVEQWQTVLQSLQISRIRLELQSLLQQAKDKAEDDSLLLYAVTTTLHRRAFEHLRRISLCRQDYSELLEEFFQSACWAMTPTGLASCMLRQMESYLKSDDRDSEEDCNPAIRIARKYIQEHYQDNISLTSMAALVNVSPVYFSMLFKREMGINFLDYLNQYRLEIAKGLLRELRYNINEVAEQSGFRDAKYFSKMFKKQFGITPTDYRKRVT